MSFTIAVPAFRRPGCLARLLHSLNVAAEFAGNFPPLIVNIDHEDSRGCDACVKLAEKFAWGGDKKVVRQSQRLGLKANVIACGDASANEGAVLVLEDDLYVSPAAFLYAEKALAFYGDDPRIASISLYSMIYNEFAKMPLIPIDDGADIYFAMTASSSGQIWTQKKWSEFRSWLANPPAEGTVVIPSEVERWSLASSWKREFNRFLAKHRYYVAFPRFSMSTNMGDIGHHFSRAITHLTSPLSLLRTAFTFVELDNALARYDQFLDIEAESLKRLVPALQQFDFDVDLTGAKSIQHLTREHVLSIRGATEKPVLSAALKHYPPELNVILAESGNDIGLHRRHAIDSEQSAERIELLRIFFWNARRVTRDGQPIIA